MCMGKKLWQQSSQVMQVQARAWLRLARLNLKPGTPPKADSSASYHQRWQLLLGIEQVQCVLSEYPHADFILYLCIWLYYCQTITQSSWIMFDSEGAEVHARDRRQFVGLGNDPSQVVTRALVQMASVLTCRVPSILSSTQVILPISLLQDGRVQCFCSCPVNVIRRSTIWC